MQKKKKIRKAIDIRIDELKQVSNQKLKSRKETMNQLSFWRTESFITLETLLGKYSAGCNKSPGG